MTPHNPADRHVADRVDDYLHDLLPPGEVREVERHLAVCPECREALGQARRRLAALESIPVPEASEELIAMTLEHVDGQARKRSRARRWFVLGSLVGLAAAALLLVGLQAYYANLSPGALDLQVLGQSQLLAGSTASLRVRLADHVRQAPQAGVPVVLTLVHRPTGQKKTLAEFTTDARGTGQPRFEVPDWADGDCELTVTARSAGREEEVRRNVKLKRSAQLMLSSDKPVYQPGQTIQVRSLALRRPDLKPVAGEPAVFTVTDPKGNVIQKETKKTSDFGIAAFDCPLATEILEGPYALAARVGDTDSKLTVEVKKYVLPKFKVAVTLDRPFYAPGQPVKATVQTDYFFGKPVAEGEVLVAALTADVRPRTVFQTTGRTDAKGQAEFSFTLPRDLVGTPQEGGDASLRVEVQVTDSAGQKQGRAAACRVTRQPLRLEVVPEGGTLVEGIANTLYLMASYADGKPAKVTIRLPGEDKPLTSTDLGVASLTITPPTGGYHATLEARDKDGLTVRKEVHLPCGAVGEDFLVRTDRAVYRGGQPLVLTVLGGGREPVFVDLIKDGQTLRTDTVDMTDGKGEITIDLPPELFGTLQLCAYRMGRDGLPVRKTRTLFVRPSARLAVEAKLDRAEYRPGESAKLALTLKDDKGQPVRGALSLAAVDEAVFAVLEQRPGLEGRFYTLEQELLEPVYAIYPWDPFAEGEPGPEQNLLEQALFAATTRTSNRISSMAGAAFGPGGRGGMVEDAPAFAPEPATPAAKDGSPRRAGVKPTEVPMRSPHSLAVSSYPDKVQQTEIAKNRGLQQVKLGWMAFGLAAGILAYAALWVFVRPLWVVGLIHGVGLLALFGLMVLATLMLMVGGKSAMMPGSAAMRGDVMFTAKEAAPAPMAMARDGAPRDEPATEGGAPAVRVRQLFPETLLWRPQVITDDQGRASLEVPLADSITTWRLSASAVTADGRLGAAQSGIKVFQPFFVDLNLPVSMTRGDEVAVPVVVYNYLDKPQTVELTLADAPWCQRLGEAVQKLELGPQEVRATSYRIRVNKVGKHQLEVTGRGSGVADALKRDIEVVPDGRRVEQVVNGALSQPADFDLVLPPEAIEGSPRALVKIYPSSFSQLVEGLDGIFQRPSGCFEQTSSTTYPNVLALDYLKKTGKAAPEVEAKARQYIHLGYQRLLGFEVSGGGFDWFGRPPANRTLTAYGLMEFEDMARVHDVDPALVRRTRAWLMAQRQRDGFWQPEGHVMHDDPTRGRGDDLARLSTTAYVAWAVFGGEGGAMLAGQAAPTRQFLLAHRAETLDDPYVLALVSNALNALDPNSQDAAPYLDRLLGLKKTAEDGKLAWWEQGAGMRTAFYGAGRSGAVETTATAVLALLSRQTAPDVTRAALAWLVRQKDERGTWMSTQATVLALKALLAGTGKPLGEGERRIQVACNGKVTDLVIPADQAEVMKMLDVTDQLQPGSNKLTLTETSGTAAGFQVAYRHYVPGEAAPEKIAPLQVELSYDRTDLKVDDTVTATARVTNRMGQTAPMVILDLPVPPGFALVAEDLDKLVRQGTIARFQVTARSGVVYLRGLPPGQPLQLTYRLRATMPVKVSVPAARAYEYYDTDKKGSSAPARLTVSSR